MAIDKRDVEKIIAGVVGVVDIGSRIATLIESIIDGGEPFVPAYSGNGAGNSPRSDYNYGHEMLNRL